MKMLVAIMLMLTLFSCQNHQQNKAPEYQDVREELINYNKKKAEDESNRIKAFVKQKKWPTTVSGTGLHYYIYEHGNGDSAKTHDMAEVRYKVSLLDGTLCYELKEDQSEVFTIGQDDVESGLHEAMLYMREGDKAYLVLPSHLAYGLTGDQSKIPRDASLVYDIELISLR